MAPNDRPSSRSSGNRSQSSGGARGTGGSSRGSGSPSRPKGKSSSAGSAPKGASGSSRRPAGSSDRPSGGRSGGGATGARGRSTRGRTGSGPPREHEEARTAGPKQWGSLGRKGAGRLTAEEFDARDSVGASGRDTRPAPAQRRSDEWVRVDDDVRSEATGAVRRGQQTRGPKTGAAKASGSRSGATKATATKERRGRDYRNAGAGSGGAEAKAELVKALGTARGTKANDRLRDAAHAYERDRYEEARSLLRPLAEQAPGAASVRELLGLTYYRLGRWKDAVRELEAFRELTGSTEQNPVLADAYRGLKRPAKVAELWEELRDASPSADLVTEGRIVMAGSLADRKKLAEAIALLEKSHRAVKRPQVHQLRQAYALADLYERAGDVARARELFRWVALHEPEFADAAERASSLG